MSDRSTQPQPMNNKRAHIGGYTGPGAAPFQEKMMSIMNDCCKKPCVHVKNTRRTDFDTTREYICCNCGHERTETIKNEGGQSYSFDSSEHGPHLPKIYFS